jgi:predicted nucleic acid-binding protein
MVICHPSLLEVASTQKIAVRPLLMQVVGIAMSGSQRNQQALDKFLAPLEILPFDETAMRRYGILRSDLERRGGREAPI